MTGGYQTINIVGMVLSRNYDDALVGTVELDDETSEILYRNRKRVIAQVTGSLDDITFTTVIAMDFTMIVEDQVPGYVARGVFALDSSVDYIFSISKTPDKENYMAEIIIS